MKIDVVLGKNGRIAEVTDLESYDKLDKIELGMPEKGIYVRFTDGSVLILGVDEKWLEKVK